MKRMRTRTRWTYMDGEEYAPRPLFFSPRTLASVLDLTARWSLQSSRIDNGAFRHLGVVCELYVN